MALLTALPQSARELDAYVDALLRLIADVSLRQAMGRACRERIADKFSLAATTAGFLSGLARARDLAAIQPCLAVSRGFAQELATLAVETTRLRALALWLLAKLEARHRPPG